MRTITTEELKEILRKHELWLNSDPQGELAYLSRANLYGADLREAYLSRANLYGADLREAYLSRANLYGADLREAYLRGAYLYGADLREANLRGANLYGANLSGADLYKANLRGADLREADLRGADLYGANLSGADLYGAKIDIPLVCPEKGSFIGYKKCKDDLIVELEIPEDALRSSATTRKCRCSKAKVISITDLGGSESGKKEAISNRDGSFVYEVGETVEVPDFDPNRWNECSTGIHFFMTKEEAVRYVY